MEPEDGVAFDWAKSSGAVDSSKQATADTVEGLTGGQVFEQPIFIVLLDCFRHADSMGPNARTMFVAAAWLFGG